jgi:hypothetical protein
VFYKHSEQNGGSGFSGSFDTWGDLILGYGWWFPLDWNEIKSDLDKMDEGKKIILKPNDKHNNYRYYFSIVKKKSNLQESIRRILREESNYTNTNVNIGDIYEESDIYQYIQKLHYKRDYDFWEGDLGERIEKFPYYVVKEIPVKDIEMDEYQLDDDDMEEYIEMFKERGSYPPIVLGKKSYGYYNIIDGTHRANALRELGFDKIICFVGKKKSNLREQQIKEGLPNRTKELILDKIRTMGFDDAASIVGGKDNLSKITGINTYEEYLNLFNDLTISTSQEKPYITLYKNDKGLNVFVIYYEVNSKMSYIFINHNILQKPFSGYNIQKSRVFRKWLKNTYDIEIKNTDFLKAYYPGEENAGGYLEYLT